MENKNYMQICRRFPSLAVMALSAFSITSVSMVRAQAADDLNATQSPTLNSGLQADSSRASSVGDPFAKLFGGQAQETAAAGGYPGSPKTGSSSSSEVPPHFEIQGMVQWRNLNENVNINTSGAATGTAFNLSRDLGLSGQTPGFLFRFLWTPEKKILHASSLLRVEYGQINRTHTRTLTGEINFEGETYPVGAAIQTQLHNASFAAAYAPLWGNDKFRIGPLFVF
jgi:hypothetical protein